MKLFLFVLALARPLGLHAGAASDSAPSFRDVSGEAGLSFIHSSGASPEKYLVETMGSGGGFLDYDGDGWMDVYLVNSGATPSSPSAPPGTNRLFRNNGDGSFSDVTEQAGVGDPSYGMGCVFADYDNDG
ncbi:MAG: VCBS repeat-containing protein, partial [Candidatus Aminicenantes bacterium]|nr:VCBS repeat-containing protein [Candidatus Aminicenantes bacterium]